MNFKAPASTTPSNDPFGDGFGAFGAQPASTGATGSAQADPFAPREAQKPPEPTPSYTYEPSTNQNDEPDYGSTATDSHYGAGDPSTLSSTMGAKKGGIFGGKGKVNDPFMMGPSPGPSTEELASIENNGGVVRWSGSNEPFAITVRYQF